MKYANKHDLLFASRAYFQQGLPGDGSGKETAGACRGGRQRACGWRGAPLGFVIVASAAAGAERNLGLGKKEKGEKDEPAIWLS